MAQSSQGAPIGSVGPELAQAGCLHLMGTYHMAVPGDHWRTTSGLMTTRLQPFKMYLGPDAIKKVQYTNFDNVEHKPHGWWGYFRQVLRLLFDYDGRESHTKNAWLDWIHRNTSDPSDADVRAKFVGVDYQNRKITIRFTKCEKLGLDKLIWVTHEDGWQKFMPDMNVDDGLSAVGGQCRKRVRY